MRPRRERIRTTAERERYCRASPSRYPSAKSVANLALIKAHRKPVQAQGERATVVEVDAAETAAGQGERKRGDVPQN